MTKTNSHHSQIYFVRFAEIKGEPSSCSTEIKLEILQEISCKCKY